ncbi:MAG: VWA domain-containing protein [Eubacterium sp.]|nr:VWA domain-containing protein [Eubacterium sp.]
MKMRGLQRSLKKRAALLLTSCILLTGCGEQPASITGLQTGQTATEKILAYTHTYTDVEIEKRIEQVGALYDGLYNPQLDMRDGFRSYTKSGATNGVVMYESAMESCDDSYCYEPVPGWSEPVDWNTEDYNPVKESGFLSVFTSPYSTFGADVDTATYTNLRRSIFENDGFGIDETAIRIEEMINYFHYDYAAPEDGNKFGVTTVLTKCPWNKDTLLLRVGVKAEEITPKGGSNIVFLIDTSGSMFDNDKLPLAQKAFSILADNLKPEDTVSIVTYAGSEEVVLEGAKGSDTEKIKKAVNSLQAYGSTNGEGGIKKAYEIAEKHFIKGGNNRIILATDGDLNVGVSSEAGLISLVEEKRETGVFLSCLGFGTGNYKDNKMEALADHGNGNYSYIDCTAEATRVLKDEMWSTLYTVAKDVKFQVEFNSEKVKGYRLIGYENRAMAAEDFANDKKDGGEVGSGQTVTVLYEIVPTDSALSIPQVESRYGNDNTEKASALTNELLAVNIRYKEPDASESKLLTYPVTEEMLREEMDDDTSFAAGVAEFGMLLRKSEYSGTASYQEIYDRLKSIPEIMEDDFKAEFVYLVKKVSK